MGKQPIKSAQDRQWEVEDALRTLQRAETIKKDKSLMGGVKKAVQELNKMALGGAPKPSPKRKK